MGCGLGAAPGIPRPKGGREGLASGEVSGRGGPRSREAAAVRLAGGEPFSFPVRCGRRSGGSQGNSGVPLWARGDGQFLVTRGPAGLGGLFTKVVLILFHVFRKESSKEHFWWALVSCVL